jgi:flagellar basal-body rod protein FlgF
METSLYVGLSAQVALERRLVAIANNVANAGTAGFRAEGMHFSTVVSRTAPFSTAFASAGASHVNSSGGGLTKTGNPLDVAIQGQGFMSLQTPQGTIYTRDGRMQMLPTGDLVSLDGHAVLDASGSPLTLDPASGAPAIGRDGMVLQDGRQTGAIGLFEIDLSKDYARYENSGFVTRTPGVPIEDFARNGFAQGFVEESNVNPILEMTNLIAVQRAFEAVSSGMEQRDSTLRDTIQALGPRSS